MAGPFDISTYEQLGGKPTPIDPKVLEAANRARRVALLGEETVARMERAAGIFKGGAVPRVRPANGPRFSAAEMNAARAQSAMPPPAGMAPTSPAAATTRMGKIGRMFGGKFGAASAVLGAGLGIIDNFDTLLPMAARLRMGGADLTAKLNDPTTPFPSSFALGGGGIVSEPGVMTAEEQLPVFGNRPRIPTIGATPPPSPATRVAAPGIGARPLTSGWVTDPREKAVANSVIESSAIPPSGTGYIRGNASGRTYRFVNASETPERAREGAMAREREMFASQPRTGFASIDAAMQATLAQMPRLRASAERKAARADMAVQTALIKAGLDAEKPSKVQVDEPVLGSNEPGRVTVVSADGTVVTHPSARKLPPKGHTYESILATAVAKRADLLGKNKNTKGVEKQLLELDRRLEEYRLKLPPLK